jgi:hypothetical protein
MYENKLKHVKIVLRRLGSISGVGIERVNLNEVYCMHVWKCPNEYRLKNENKRLESLKK